MALVLLAPSLSWPLYLVACLFTLIGLVAVLKEGAGKRLAAALLMAVVLCVPAVVKASEEDEDFLRRTYCAQWAQTGDWRYWFYECWLYGY